MFGPKDLSRYKANQTSSTWYAKYLDLLSFGFTLETLWLYVHIAFGKNLSIWYIFTYFFVILQTQYNDVMLSHPGSAIILKFSMISSFTTCGVRSPFLSHPYLNGLEVPSQGTKLVDLKWPTPSFKEAITPANSHKRSLILSTATLKNVHINTYITEYTSMKRINTTLEFLLCKNARTSPSKCLWPFLPLQVGIGIVKANPTSPTKGKERKSKNEGREQGLYRHRRLHAFTQTPAGWRRRRPAFMSIHWSRWPNKLELIICFRICKVGFLTIFNSRNSKFKKQQFNMI